MVELRKKQGLAPAIAYTATKLGKGYTDHIRHITYAIQQQEDSLLKVRKQTNAKNTAAFNRFSVAMFVLSGIFTIFLLIIIRKYLLQKKEKAERAGELVIANKNLLFQNAEKEKRAVELAFVRAELAIAQEEIFYQSNEKGERAEELLIANEELFFQNEEKGKRAAELIIANEELFFQNDEKGKRAAELIIANKELLFQNEEKEKRSEELIIANAALLFQNNEKEKRAAELTIANKELSFQNKEKEKRAAELKLAEIARIKIVNELMTRNRDLEQFAYIISHNLRAPVANIIGASSALNDIKLSTEDKDILSRGINVSVLKLDGVVNDLNYILQVKGEINGIKEMVHFSELVDDIKISINNLIDKEAIEIKYDFSEINELLTLKPYLYSIFFNLISNSVKYRRPEIHTVIKISSRLQKNKLKLIFSDNGIGMNLKKSGSQVFDLYKRFHTNIGGKGMGLFMVKTQVETLGGKINIKSTENEGTEFIVDFEI
jgi:signal transduction histidine kinase/CHASE3 domain sensor protein